MVNWMGVLLVLVAVLCGAGYVWHERKVKRLRRRSRRLAARARGATSQSHRLHDELSERMNLAVLLALIGLLSLAAGLTLLLH
ncbi:MAG: hypothetical protein REJ24_13230 [Rhodocyclaceae bacterium]|nr:hypothetical protein [Pseudomonadota bacterium]MDQ7973525.1 hypothetical protein [Rhodocyclaceae bacterium]MDQ7998431.1 hypothetical protein [Pseudomonadota bacterium]MDQ8016292.1 hypothetical protein [Pseudomonadota bacterium]